MVISQDANDLFKEIYRQYSKLNRNAEAVRTVDKIIDQALSCVTRKHGFGDSNQDKHKPGLYSHRIKLEIFNSRRGIVLPVKRKQIVTLILHRWSASFSLAKSHFCHDVAPQLSASSEMMQYLSSSRILT